MPAPLAVDKEQVRMLVLSVGVREAARRCGIKEATVQGWSADGKWLAATRPTPALMPPPASMVGATSATKPADALADVLADDSKATKLSLSRVVRKTSAHLETLDGEELVAQAPNVKATVQSASALHAWEDRAGNGIRISIFNGQVSAEEGPVIDV